MRDRIRTKPTQPTSFGTFRESLVRKTRRAAAALAIAGMATGALAGPAAACLQGIGNGTYAKSVRTLQSDMMVAALSCNERGLYNAFAVAYRTDLQRHGKALRAYFKETHGAQHLKRLNAYVTQLANDASIRHARTGKDYCQAAREVLRELLPGENERVDIDGYALRYAISVRPQLAQEIQTAAGGTDASCEELVALNLPSAD